MTGKTGLFRLTALLMHLLLGMPLVAHAQKIPVSSSFPLSAWILLAGVAVAVLLAVFIMGWQYWRHRWQDESREKRKMAKEEAHESAEMRSLLCSARHELAFFYMSHREGAGEMLGQIGGGGYLEHAVPVEHERYYIYPICASNIGKVKDARLGMQILSAYTMQIRFIETMKWNNNLLRWLRETRKRRVEYQDRDSARAEEQLEKDLRDHVPKMLSAFDEMEVATKTVMEYINEDGTINPRSRHKLHSRYYFLNSPQTVRYR